MIGRQCIPVFGPPGTGKTHTLLDLIDGLLSSGVCPSDIAFFTFTRNARAEALDRLDERFGLSPDEVPWCRTIHSAALNLLGKGSSVMGPKHWREFAKAFGYALSEDTEAGDEPYTPPTATEHDRLRAVHTYLRNRRMPAGEPGRAPIAVRADLYGLYIRRLAEFKADHRLMDFTDFLEFALDRGVRPPVSILFIDEAQDLSPLQQELVTMWADGRQVYTAGDDDQAIFSFQGANPAWLIEVFRSWRSQARLLDQSWRVPRSAHAIADLIVSRNRQRVPKVYRPRDHDGHVRVVEWSDATRLIGELSEAPPVANSNGEGTRGRKTYLLARNWQALTSWRRLLDGRGVVYGMARGSCWATDKRRQAVHAAKSLIDQGHVFSADLGVLLEHYPSRGDNLPVKLPHGVKTAVQEHGGRLYPQQLSALGLDPWIAHLRKVGPTEILVTEDRDVREYLDRALRRYSGAIPAVGKASGLHLSTIHSTKGNEADTVVMLSDMAWASHKEFTAGSQAGFEAENRVAYVGVTRTRDELVIVKPENAKCAYPYQQLAKEAGVVGQ
jgi:DNA helicase II / ATP-dependent DNA helicase PcrA